MSVVVSDPGFLPTTRQMALALVPELESYWTPYAPGPRSRALLRVPKLGAELARRTLPPELERRTHTLMTGREVARIAAGRTGIRARAYELLWSRNERFDAQVAARLQPGGTVVAQYGAALATFRRTGANGLCVLDYPIARLDWAQALLAEEAARRPDWADSILGGGALFHEPRHLARMSEELELADMVVVGSKFAASSFDTDGRTVVVPYGAETSRFSPRRGPRRPGPLRILFAGQVTQRKGVADLLDAAVLLGPERFELTIAGPLVGSGRGLRAYDGRFRHTGAVLPARMPALFQDADVLALPSLVEGSAVVVLEALAAGLPVVVTPNAGADSVTDGVEGFVVPVRAPEALAERLELLLDDDVRARMSAAAAARGRASDWSAFRVRFRQLVAEAGAPAPLVERELVTA